MVKEKLQFTFSVLLPTHNRDDVISYAIEAVLAQTCSDFELLIVGDGCTDSTEKIVKSFMKKDKRISWFLFPKGHGFGYAHRNTVMKHAKGKYIAFAAHDDLWFPDHLENFFKFFRNHPDYSIAYSRPLWIHPDGIIAPSLFNTNVFYMKHDLLNFHNEIPASSVCYTRDALKQVFYWNQTLSHSADWDLIKKIVTNDPKKRIGFIEIPTAIHFRAIWRTEKNAWNQFLEATYQKIHSSREFSHKFSISGPSKKPLQQVVWQKYMQSPTWIVSIRAACQKYFNLNGLPIQKNISNYKRFIHVHLNDIGKYPFHFFEKAVGKDK